MKFGTRKNGRKGWKLIDDLSNPDSNDSWETFNKSKKTGPDPCTTVTKTLPTSSASCKEDERGNREIVKKQESKSPGKPTNLCARRSYNGEPKSLTLVGAKIHSSIPVTSTPSVRHKKIPDFEISSIISPIDITLGEGQAEGPPILECDATLKLNRKNPVNNSDIFDQLVHQRKKVENQPMETSPGIWISKPILSKADTTRQYAGGAVKSKRSCSSNLSEVLEDAENGWLTTEETTATTTSTDQKIIRKKDDGSSCGKTKLINACKKLNDSSRKNAGVIIKSVENLKLKESADRLSNVKQGKVSPSNLHENAPSGRKSPAGSCEVDNAKSCPLICNDVSDNTPMGKTSINLCSKKYVKTKSKVEHNIETQKEVAFEQKAQQPVMKEVKNCINDKLISLHDVTKKGKATERESNNALILAGREERCNQEIITILHENPPSKVLSTYQCLEDQRAATAAEMIKDYENGWVTTEEATATTTNSIQKSAISSIAEKTDGAKPINVLKSLNDDKNSPEGTSKDLEVFAESERNRKEAVGKENEENADKQSFEKNTESGEVVNEEGLEEKRKHCNYTNVVSHADANLKNLPKSCKTQGQTVSNDNTNVCKELAINGQRQLKSSENPAGMLCFSSNIAVKLGSHTFQQASSFGVAVNLLQNKVPLGKNRPQGECRARRDFHYQSTGSKEQGSNITKSKEPPCSAVKSYICYGSESKQVNLTESSGTRKVVATVLRNPLNQLGNVEEMESSSEEERKLLQSQSLKLRENQTQSSKSGQSKICSISPLKRSTKGIEIPTTATALLSNRSPLKSCVERKMECTQRKEFAQKPSSLDIAVENPVQSNLQPSLGVNSDVSESSSDQNVFLSRNPHDFDKMDPDDFELEIIPSSEDEDFPKENKQQTKKSSKTHKCEKYQSHGKKSNNNSKARNVSEKLLKIRRRREEALHQKHQMTGESSDDNSNFSLHNRSSRDSMCRIKSIKVPTGNKNKGGRKKLVYSTENESLPNTQLLQEHFQAHENQCDVIVASSVSPNEEKIVNKKTAKTKSNEIKQKMEQGSHTKVESSNLQTYMDEAELQEEIISPEENLKATQESSENGHPLEKVENRKRPLEKVENRKRPLKNNDVVSADNVSSPHKLRDERKNLQESTQESSENGHPLEKVKNRKRALKNNDVVSADNVSSPHKLRDERKNSSVEGMNTEQGIRLSKRVREPPRMYWKSKALQNRFKLVAAEGSNNVALPIEKGHTSQQQHQSQKRKLQLDNGTKGKTTTKKKVKKITSAFEEESEVLIYNADNVASGSQQSCEAGEWQDIQCFCGDGWNGNSLILGAGANLPNLKANRCKKMFYVLEGEVNYKFAGTETKLKAGSFFAVPQDGVYQLRNTGDSLVKLVSMSCKA